MLRATDLNQHYGSSQTLRNLNFQVKRGSCTALLGRNGVGKSTLLKCLMGVLPLSSGTVEIEGNDISAASPHQRAAKGIAYVPQGREIFPRLTVEENLQIGMVRRRGPGARTIPADIFDMFPVLKSMLGRRGGDLSGGQQQQLAIARALVSEPKLLILDEPTEGIQPSIIKEIERVIATLTKRGDMAILLVEQYYEFAQRLADHFFVMSRGEFVLQGAGHEMDALGARSHVAV
jgi:urea transport system ATP-binding protein